MLPCMNMSAGSPPAGNGTIELAEHVRTLKDQLAAVIEAVEVLARSLESSPMAEPRDRHIEKAARRAHELLLLAKSAAPGAEPAGDDANT